MGSSASKSNLARRRMAKNAREQTSFAREQEKFAREQKKIAREQIMVYLLASNLLLLAEVPLTATLLLTKKPRQAQKLSEIDFLTTLCIHFFATPCTQFISC